MLFDLYSNYTYEYIPDILDSMLQWVRTDLNSRPSFLKSTEFSTSVSRMSWIRFTLYLKQVLNCAKQLFLVLVLQNGLMDTIPLFSKWAKWMKPMLLNELIVSNSANGGGGDTPSSYALSNEAGICTFSTDFHRKPTFLDFYFLQSTITPVKSMQ